VASWRDSIVLCPKCLASAVLLVHGREARLPPDNIIVPESNLQFEDVKSYLQQVQKTIDSAFRDSQDKTWTKQERQKWIADNKRKPNKFKANDIVWLKKGSTQGRNIDKLAPTNEGPFKIISVSGNVSQIVHLENENNQQSVNVSRLILQRAKEKPKKKDEVEWELEKIITSRINQDGQEEVLVKWRGFTKRFNSWIPINNLHADDMLEEFRGRGRPVQKRGGRKRI